MPVTSFTRNVQSNWNYPLQTYRRFYKWQNGNRRKPVTDEPLAYFVRTGSVLGYSFHSFNPDAVYAPRGVDLPNNQLAFNMETGAYGTEIQAAKNRSYGRLKEGVYTDEAAIGAAIAEWRSSLDTIQTRSLQIYRAFRALKRGNFSKFRKELGVRPKRKHSKTVFTRPKDASAIWLEYWLGWAPLVGDIYSAMDVLGKPVKSVTVTGRASVPITWTRVFEGLYDRHTETIVGRISVQQGAKFRVINANEALAARMGLSNPAAIAWELVPFSFVVDWFVRVGDSLSAYSDFNGLEVTNAFTSVYQRGVYGCVSVSKNYGVTSHINAYNVHFRRSLGLSLPLPVFQAPTRLSVTRAATAVSLLLSLFSKG